jgi:hypothetical protein
MRLILVAFTSVATLTACHAIAAERPTVPAAAQKLDAAGIMELYQGSHATFNNYSAEKSLSGAVWYNLKGGTMWGNYLWDGKDRGVFKGKASVKGDKFCYKSDDDKKPTCATVYRDGTTYYEVDDKNLVTSMDTLQPNNVGSVPASAKPVPPDVILAAANGKKVFVTIYDAGVPMIAAAQWDVKRKQVSGEYVKDGKEKGKFKIKFAVKNNMICFKQGKQDDCYSYHVMDNAFYETTTDGKLHAVSFIP